MRRTLTNERYEVIKQCIVGLLEEYRVKTIPLEREVRTLLISILEICCLKNIKDCLRG